MAWLFPLYCLGALAVAAPILFHMWQRRPRTKRSFSALMFLTPSPPRISSRNRIEHWVLLCLRGAALILIALAFARPIWRTPAADAPAAKDSQSILILVDTSASMRRTGVWADGLRQLEERLAELPPKTSLALYRFDQEFVPVLTFRDLEPIDLSARQELIRAKLRELSPMWADTNLGNALINTATVLQEAQTEHPNPIPRTVWLMSDLQTGSDISRLRAYEWPTDLPVEVILAKPRSATNAGLQLVEKNVEAGEDESRLRVTNSPDSSKDQFTLKWDTPNAPAVAVYIPAGQSRVLTTPPLPAEATSSKLILEGDDNEFDNQIYFADTTIETRVIAYCGPESSNDVDGARYYLDRVLSASARYQIELKECHEMNAATDAMPSLIVLTQPESKTQPLVKNHLRKGGLVLVASPTPETLQDSIKLCGIEGISATEATVARYAMLGDIDFEHPLFTPFAESQFSDFTGIRFWKHRSLHGLTTAETLSKDESIPPCRFLARFDDGDPAIVELPVDRGRVLIFAAGWQPADSQLARSSKFPTLMFRLLELTTGTTPRIGNRTVKNSIDWPSVAFLEEGSTGKVILPDGRELKDLPLDRPFDQTDTPGIYTLSVPGRTERVAVNLAPDESRTAPLTFEQLETLGLPLKSHERPHELKRKEERERQLQLVELEETQKIWKTVLTVALLLLLFETFLGGFLESRSRAVNTLS